MLTNLAVDKARVVFLLLLICFLCNCRQSETSSNYKVVKRFSTGYRLRTSASDPYCQSRAVWSRSRKWLATVGGERRWVKLWNTETGEKEDELGGHTRWIDTICFSPDERFLVSAGADAIRMWDVNTKKVLREISSDSMQVFGLGFSSDGKILATGEKRIKFWDVETGELISKIEVGCWITSLIFISENKEIICGDEKGNISFFRVGDGEKIGQIVSGKQGILSISVSPDEKRLVSGGWDNELKLWDLESRQLLNIWPGKVDWWKDFLGCNPRINSAEFSPDGRYVAIGVEADNGCQIIDTVTWKLKFELRVHSESVISAVFSTDGSQVMTAGKDSKICISQLEKASDK